MLKVLIVDDEVKVCQLILHLVDWEAMNLEVVDILHDGQTALEYIVENKPDIVISDIRMPNCDGLEMIKQAKGAYPDISFIIISGYSNFEYAQNAIHYGVQDYLLKPLRKEELVNTLIKIKEKHFSILEQQIEQNKWKSLAESSREKVKKSLIADLILNPEKINFNNVDEFNKEYHTHFIEGYYAVLKIQPFIRGKRLSDEERDIALTKIQQMLKERLTKYCQEVIFMVYEDSVILIINVNEPSFFEVKKQLKKMRLDIINLKSIFQALKVYIGIGSVVDNLGGLAISMEQAKAAIFDRLSNQEKYIIEYQTRNEDKQEVSDLLDTQMKNDLHGNLERLNPDGIIVLLQELKNRVLPYSENGKLVFDCYMEVVGIIVYGFKDFSSEFDIPPVSYYEKLYETYFSLEDVFNGLEKEISELLERYSENVKLAETKPIRLAKQYINDNYNLALSLESISAQIGFNPAYFSTLFKKETGKNFMEYVMEIRVQNAKNFLASTNKTLVDISTEVGYSDFKYFSKVFKRITGLTPSEYRKLYS